jgi:ABC-type polysaccharide/polyol phosphate export permease
VCVCLSVCVFVCVSVVACFNGNSPGLEVEVPTLLLSCVILDKFFFTSLGVRIRDLSKIFRNLLPTLTFY